MPPPLALLPSITPSLTCLSTVIFESLVISAAWFRRSTTWKEREGQVMAPALPAQLPWHSLGSATWRGIAQTGAVALPAPSPLLHTHSL